MPIVFQAFKQTLCNRGVRLIDTASAYAVLLTEDEAAQIDALDRDEKYDWYYKEKFGAQWGFMTE